MKYFPTGTQMRDADMFTIEKIGIPSLVLMERAALEVVNALQEYDLTKILVVCGSGNNGGDGYAIARLLYLQGYAVEIYFVGNDSSRSEENRKQKEISEYYRIPFVEELIDKNYSVIIDAVFGTGLKRNLEGVYLDTIEKMNRLSGLKVAVDIPSGINDTTGEVMGGALKADMTVAIAFAKRGTILYPGAEYSGKIVIGDIGITQDTLFSEHVLTYGFEFDDLKKLYPKRNANSHKGTFGKVLLVVGSKGMSGAAYLCAKTVYEVGAGLVQIYTTEDNRIILQELLPEAIISTYNDYDEAKMKELLKWADVIGIGSGLGQSDVAVKLVRQTLASATCPCIIDADALNIIAEHTEWLKECKTKVVLTPHMKEMSRLLQCSVAELTQERVSILTKYASEYPVTCVLKDARTLVVTDGRDMYLNVSGNSAMAKAGSGDVLVGVITGIAAQRVELHDAASLGVYLHGLAGDLARDKNGQYSVLASDIADGVGEILKQI